jgi:hypothetical protein
LRIETWRVEGISDLVVIAVRVIEIEFARTEGVKEITGGSPIRSSK